MGLDLLQILRGDRPKAFVNSPGITILTENFWIGVIRHKYNVESS